MITSIRRALQDRSWDKLTSLPPGRLMAILFVLVVPGGLLLPICYALVATIRSSAQEVPPRETSRKTSSPA
jgi:hypothetical protein